MKKFLFTLLALCSTVMLQATVLGKHLTLNLRQDNIPVEQAQQYFDQWMKINDYVTFELVKDEIDELGYRHQQYVQKYNGVTVDESRLLVHSKDGKITYVNGFVMEANAQRPRRALSRNSVSVPEGSELVLVEIFDGFHYAVKSFDHKTMDYVYTDVETGEVIKRQSTILHAAPVGQKTVKGNSYYYGTLDIDVTQTDDGRLLLADSIRKIYTYNAGSADTIPDEYFTIEYDQYGNQIPSIDSLNSKNYIDKYVPVTDTKRDHFTMHQVSTATITLNDKAQSELKGENLEIFISLNNLYVSITDLTVKDFPYTLVPEKILTNNEIAYPWRMSDTDNLSITLRNSDQEILDMLILTPNADDGKADIKTNGYSGKMTVDASLKPCGHYGVDAHWGMERVYDFYNEVLGRKSYDNCGSPIITFINPDHAHRNPLLHLDEPNAFASYTSINRMVFGRGDLALGYDEQVEIGTMAHEFTHLVTGKTAQLGTEGEPGALNEAYSDMFCAAVNNYVANKYLTQFKGDIKHIYGIGTDSESKSEYGCSRSFYDPWIQKTAKALQGKYWVKPYDQYDKGGVHCNCGVMNFWFYLVSEGYDPAKCMMDTTVIDRKFATTEKWNGIGIDKAIKIAYRTLTRYLVPKASFLEANMYTLQACIDLVMAGILTEEDINVVEKSFSAVIPTEMEITNSLAEIVEPGINLETAYTSKVFSQTENKLVDNSQESINNHDILPGIVTLNCKISLVDPEALRKLISNPSEIHKLTVDMISPAFENHSPVFDFSEAFRKFLTTCVNEKKSAGYSETLTASDTLECGGPIKLVFNAPTMHLEQVTPIDVVQQPRTYLERVTVLHDTVQMEIRMLAPYDEKSNYAYKPMELIKLGLYKVEASGETLVERFQQEFMPQMNKAMQETANTFFANTFFAQEENMKPGDYVLKVQSTWADLLNADLKFNVPEPSGITNVKADKGEDTLYDLQGRKVTGPMDRGIYIKDGKKVMIK